MSILTSTTKQVLTFVKTALTCTISEVNFYSNLGLKSFKFICHEENRFLFYGPTRPWSGPYVENKKLMMILIVFLICVINGSGVAFGQVANLLQFIPYHMTALPVYMCLDSQASYNLERRKTSTCVSL